MLEGFVISPYGTVIAKENIQLRDIPKLALHIGRAICGIHKNEVIHRDITPNNIIVNEDEYFLIDFNVAYRWRSCNFSPCDSFVGTRRWASLRRQRLKSGKYPNPSPLDDWESLFLTLLELSVGFDTDSWSGFQGFSEFHIPNISDTKHHFFLVSWYKHLVAYQTQVPLLKDYEQLASLFLSDPQRICMILAA